MTITALFQVNIYAVIYIVNGEEWARDSVAYGQPIVLREYTPAEGETFNGWNCDDYYETMPAHDIVYSTDITSGIVSLFTDRSAVDVYTLQGTLVVRKMPVAELKKRLPHGVYIINGVKVAIR